MAETHLNAYEMDVREAEAKVADANAEYRAAKQRLEDKKRQLGVTDESAPAPEKDESPDSKSAKLKKK